MRKLSLAFVLVTGVIPAHAAPLTIDSGSQSYYVTSNETVDEIRVGYINDFNRLLVQNGATLTTTSNYRLYLGYGVISSNNGVNVNGTGSTIDTLGDWTFVGLYGDDNTLSTSNGGTVNSYGGHVGYYPDSTGNRALIGGVNSSWNLLTEHLYVGREGDNNEVWITAGGTIAISATGKGLRIGVLPDAETNRVTVTGSGSILDADDDIYVGQAGTNNLLAVTYGGSVENADGFLRYMADSSGTGKVTGTDSNWNNAASLHVGYYGRGTLIVEAAGVVSSTSGYIAGYSGSTGVATITGHGSEWDNSNSLHVGGDTPGSGGSGTLNVNDRGLVTVSDTTKLYSTGTINLNGGSLTTGSFDNSAAGVLNFLDGTLTVNGAGGSFGKRTTGDHRRRTARPADHCRNSQTGRHVGPGAPGALHRSCHTWHSR